MATYRGRKLTPIEDAALEVLVNNLAPNPEDYRIDDVNEDVHPMGVHVKEVPGKKVEGLPAYKVTKVGSKVKEHGGLKVGEHIHDNHIDDLADMGHKIKTEEVDQVDELNVRTMRSYVDKADDRLVDMGQDKKSNTPAFRKRQQGIARAKDKIQTKKIQQRQDFAKRNFGGKVVEDTEQIDEFDMEEKDPQKHARSKQYHYDLGKKTAMAGKEKGETSDNYGPYASDYESGYHSVKNKFKPIRKEEMEDQKTLADYAAEILSNTVGEGKMKDMVTGHMDKGKSYNDAMKAAQKDLDKMAKKAAVPKPVKEELSAAQKKLPPGLQKAIMKKKGKSVEEANHEVDGVPIQKIPENPKHTAKMKKAAKMHKSIPAAQRGTGAGGKRGGDSGFKPTKMGEEIEQVDETIEYHDYYDIKIAEEYTYEDFVKAAMVVTDGGEDAIQIAEDCFYNNDISIIIEEFTRSDIEDKIKVHKKAGSSVTMPKYTMKDDKMHAEYTVTDKKGMRRRHIHHGNISKLENMGKVNVSPDKED